MVTPSSPLAFLAPENILSTRFTNAMYITLVGGFSIRPADQRILSHANTWLLEILFENILRRKFAILKPFTSRFTHFPYMMANQPYESIFRSEPSRKL